MSELIWVLGIVGLFLLLGYFWLRHLALQDVAIKPTKLPELPKKKLVVPKPSVKNVEYVHPKPAASVRRVSDYRRPTRSNASSTPQDDGVDTAMLLLMQQQVNTPVPVVVDTTSRAWDIGTSDSGSSCSSSYDSSSSDSSSSCDSGSSSSSFD